jgi:hypothetical protein
MKSEIIIALTMILSITACGTAEKTITPPYDINSPNTRIAWCPSDVCTNSSFYLNTAYFANDTLLTFDDRLLVYHGAYCTILEERTVEDYIWTDEFNEQTHLSDVEVWLVECDNRFRRGSDGNTEFIDGSYSTEGWVFPNAMMTISERD